MGTTFLPITIKLREKLNYTYHKKREAVCSPFFKFNNYNRASLTQPTQRYNAAKQKPQNALQVNNSASQY